MLKETDYASAAYLNAPNQEQHHTAINNDAVMQHSISFEAFNLGLDLTPIKYSLTQRPDGPAWSGEYTEAVEKNYRRFLYLAYLYPEAVIVPSEPVDTFWHYHILDTIKYAEDCQSLFSTYFHHFPYFGLRGDNDKEHLEQTFRETEQLYLKHFGETPRMSIGGKESSYGTLCGGGSCKGGGCRGSMPVTMEERPAYTSTG